MKRYYGKRAWVPSQCPVCKKGSIKDKKASLSDLIGEYFSVWYIGADKHQPGFDGILRWYGRCGACHTQKLLTGPSLFDLIRERENIG